VGGRFAKGFNLNEVSGWSREVRFQDAKWGGGGGGGGQAFETAKGREHDER